MTIRKEHYEVLRTLSREQLADLMLGLMGDTDTADPMVKMVQHFIVSDSKIIEQHIEDLEAIAERENARQEQNRINGAKGGRPAKKDTEKKQKPVVKTNGKNQWLKPVVITGGFDEEKETEEKENFPPHPLYKEKEDKEKEGVYNNDDIAHARVESFALLSSLSEPPREILNEWANALGHPPEEVMKVATIVTTDWANSCERDVSIRHLFQAIKYQFNKNETYGKIRSTDRTGEGNGDNPLAKVIVRS